MSAHRMVVLLAAALGVAGCNDSALFSLNESNPPPLDDDDDMAGGDDDDDGVDDDDSGAPYDDGQPDDDDVSDDDDDAADDDDTADDDDAGDDECYDPDSAYDLHPAAGLVVTQELDLAVTFEGSDAGYTNELWLNSPTSVYLGTGHITATGTVTPLGTFAPGTELIFSIIVTDNGDTFFSGPASRNADDFVHVAVTYTGDCTWVVGFEDTWGGGDQDFNDIELTITGPLEMQLVE